jgi:YVTN family beta-propeller protein
MAGAESTGLHSAAMSAMARRRDVLVGLALTGGLALGALPGCNATSDHQPPSRSESGTLIVLNKSDDSLSLIDAMTGDRLLDLPTGAGPHEVAVSPDGSLAVVSNYGRPEEPGHTLTVVDLAGSKVVGTIDLGEHARPHGVQFLPDGRTLVATTEASGSVLLVDVTARRVIRAVPTRQQISHMVVLDPLERRAYVANIGSASVSVVDLDKAYVVAQIPAGQGAEGIDLSPDGRELWVTNRQDDSVTIIDTRQLTATVTLPCAGGPIRVKLTPDGARALISNSATGDIAVFDTAARSEIGRIPLAFSELESTDSRLFGDGVRGQSPIPVGLLVSPDGSRAWVASTNANLVTVLDLGALEVAGRIKAGNEPDGLGWTPVIPLGM